MTWYTRPLAAFDLETTGVDTATDRIVSAAIWRIDPARPYQGRHHLVGRPRRRDPPGRY